jgi:hypothetical protein
MAAMAAERLPVMLGTLPTEIVIRGGHLKQPEMLKGLLIINERRFVPLIKANKVLSGFLAGVTPGKRPLARTLIIEKLAELRNTKHKELVAELRMPAGEDAAAIAPIANGPVDDLELDSPGVAPVALVPVDRKSRAKCLRFVGRQLPQIVVVSVERPDGTTWSPAVVLDRNPKAPAMECTAENLQALFDFVQADFEDGTLHRRPYGSDRPPVVAKAPRQYPDGSREYFVRGRWVRKTKLPPIPPANVRFKTLKRKSSDEVAVAAAKPARAKSSRKGARARGRGQKGAAAVPLADAEGLVSAAPVWDAVAAHDLDIEL